MPSATPSRAVGNSISRSANDSQVTLPGCSQVAILVLISREICATDTPSVAGAICFRIRCTVGSRQACRKSSDQRGVRPRRASASHCTASCATPPAITPRARA
ncbi:Uncharacterised protein [Bordetella pertussis]|nr:Uncharacterised protein [Bordetella pertussis]CFW03347.1 Uncharacterised protein [Bordetella pertussis]CFW42913.1 Uncharacterised protein [Bordetella pertussis]